MGRGGGTRGRKRVRQTEDEMEKLKLGFKM